ncbi:MAG: 2-phosphosulfolactate phosphatase [Candidatus Muirbacterium halophilum]|nr:2-phosphosulfolactate phosphatase [Candidatus Muirbacterium halophilum]MCK9476186.1 2-phosphosulfolactate phosphatase [Candidatus Muirbacterium halophilum]
MLNIFTGKDESSKATGNTIVVDIICATSMICYFFHKGANKIIPLSKHEDIPFIKEKYPDILLAGDYPHLYPNHFDVNIFDRESFEKFDPKGRDLFYISANGTKRIFDSNNAKKHIMGSFLNFSAIIELIRKNPTFYCLLLAGSEKFTWDEDCSFAEMLNLELNNKKYNKNDYHKRILNSDVMKRGNWIVKAPYLIEIALSQDITKIIPVTLTDKETGFTILKPLSEI